MLNPPPPPPVVAGLAAPAPFDGIALFANGEAVPDEAPAFVVTLDLASPSFAPSCFVEVARWSGWRSLDGQGGGR